MNITRTLALAGAIAALAACTSLEDSPPPTAAPEAPETLVGFTLTGTVSAVEDGDTLTLTARNRARFVIRLSDLDTPEVFHKGGPDRSCPGRVLGDRPGQPLGQEARRSLQSLALRRQARADCYEIDRYGRPVCHVHVAGRNLNLAQIERGWGMLPERAEWVRDPASREAEAKARARKTGVWAKPDALHPATWRERCWGQGECSGAES